MLIEENILIKDLAGKHGFEAGQFIRVCVRTEEENNQLLKGIDNLLASERILNVVD